MIEFLIAGRPFLYQTIDDGHVFHVDKDGVKEIVGSWTSENHIVAFVDANAGNTRPQQFLLDNPRVQYITTTSPKGVYQKWVKQKGDHVTLARLITSLWSAQELFLTGLVLSFLVSTLN